MSTKPDITAGQERPDPEMLLAELAGFKGDLERYRHWTGRLVYTPGIQHLAEKAGAYWLIDLVASWQIHAAVAKEDFQIWQLVVRSDHTATATATSDTKAPLASQDIPHTDFPLPEITLWLMDGTLILPSEY